jgi:dCTP deaminase
MILSAQSIRKRCLQESLITPFEEHGRYGGMTYGLSAAGYDIRIDQAVTLQPGKFALASSIELFRMPDYLIAFVNDKSSWARRGLAVQNTVIEPGWTGFLTLELTNHSDMEFYIMRGLPIAQIVFQLLDYPTEQPYDGKYQNQPPGPQQAIYEP